MLRSVLAFTVFSLLLVSSARASLPAIDGLFTGVDPNGSPCAAELRISEGFSQVEVTIAESVSSLRSKSVKKGKKPVSKGSALTFPVGKLENPSLHQKVSVGQTSRTITLSQFEGDSDSKPTGIFSLKLLRSTQVVDEDPETGEKAEDEIETPKSVSVKDLTRGKSLECRELRIAGAR